MPIPGKLPGFIQFQIDAYSEAKERAATVIGVVTSTENVMRFKRNVTDALTRWLSKI